MAELMKNLFQGENKFIEYKAKYTKSLLKTVSAFSNFHDGFLIIGVSDDGGIIGVGNPENERLSPELQCLPII